MAGKKNRWENLEALDAPPAQQVQQPLSVPTTARCIPDDLPSAEHLTPLADGLFGLFLQRQSAGTPVAAAALGLLLLFGAGPSPFIPPPPQARLAPMRLRRINELMEEAWERPNPKGGIITGDALN